MVGVSVRMLHHYDKIGLLVPENINQFNGYRYYGTKNLETIQQLLFFKELDFSLKEIKDMINDVSFNKLEALTMQRNLLNMQKDRLGKMVAFIDTLLITGETDMSKQIKEVLNQDDFNKQKLKYAKEAKDKWGKTNSYKQSQKRMAKYSKQDIANLNTQQENIYQNIASLMSLGIENKKVQEKIHQARLFISNNWYDCNLQQFAALGEMYIADQRFKDNIDKHGEGLAEFINKAIVIYTAP